MMRLSTRIHGTLAAFGCAALLAAGCTGGGQGVPGAGTAGPGLAPAWAEFGPKPQFNGVSGEQVAGRVSCLLALDANTLLVGSASGGVWRSSDAGRTWTPTTDAMPNSNIGALARDPNSPDVIYCGTGEANGPGRASTGGIQARKVVKGGPAAIRTGVGIYRSGDAGRTWSLMPSTSLFERMALSRILVDPADSRRLLVATTSGELSGPRPFGLYLSEDGGATWRLLSGTGGFPASPYEVTDAAFQPGNSRVVLAGVYRQGIYRSANGGADWQAVPLDTGGRAVGRIAFAPSPADPAVVYALVGSDYLDFLGLYASVDGGASFEVVGSGAELNQVLGGQAFYNVAITADGARRDVVYVGGVELFRADVDLANLAVRYTGLSNGDEPRSPHVDHHVLALGPSGQLLTGNDGGVWSLPNPATSPAWPGTNWSNLNGGTDGAAMGTIQFVGVGLHPTDPYVIFGGSQDNNTARCGGTLTWLERIPLEGGEFVMTDGGKSVIDPVHPENIWILQQQGRFYLSTNGGQSYRTANQGLDFTQQFQFYTPLTHGAAEGRTTVATGFQGIFEADAGQGVWTQTSGGPLLPKGDSFTALAYSPQGPGVLYAGSNEGRVYVRTEAGGTFALRGSGLPGQTISGLAVDPYDPQRAYCTVQAYGTGKVFRTLDGGLTWTDLTGTLPDVPHNDVVIDHRDPTRYVYVANDTGVWLTDDDGAHWHRYGVGLARAPVVDLEIGAVPRRLAAATHGRGLWEVTLFGDTFPITPPPAGAAPRFRSGLPPVGGKHPERTREF